MSRNLCASIIAISLAAPTPSAQRKEGDDRKKEPPFKVARARWEYKVMPSHALEAAGMGRLENGLNQLGEEGWELVAVEVIQPTPAHAAARTTYIFKRSRGGLALPPRLDPVPEKEAAATKVFVLRHARAAESLKVLADLFRDRGEVRFAVDDRTNTLVVHGQAELLAEAEAIVARLDVPAKEKERKLP